FHGFVSLPAGAAAEPASAGFLVAAGTSLIAVKETWSGMCSPEELRPGQAGPVRRPFSPEPLDRRVRLPPVGGFLLYARAVARRELRHRVAHLCARPSPGHHDHAWPIPRADEGVLGPGGRVEEVPGPEPSLLALDEQPAFSGDDEERLLVRFGMEHGG